MYFVYIIKSKSSEYSYVGMTSNLGRRLLRHNSNKEKATRNRGPFYFVFVGMVGSIKIARGFEKLLKAGFVKEKIRNIIGV